MKTLNDMTYDALLDRAATLSMGGYAAVVEITYYMQSRTSVTVMSGKDPIRSFSRGGGFVGVCALFRDGEPLLDRVAHASLGEDSEDTGELPF